MRHLQFGARAALLKDQKRRDAAPRRLQIPLPICPQNPDKGGTPTVGPCVLQLYQIIVQLLRGPPLHVRLPGIGLPPLVTNQWLRCATTASAARSSEWTDARAMPNAQ